MDDMAAGWKANDDTSTISAGSGKALVKEVVRSIIMLLERIT